MAEIKLCKNPLETRDIESFEFSGVLVDFLQDIAPDGFGNPIRVFVNEQELALENLDIDVEYRDTVLILVMPAAAVGYVALQLFISFMVSETLTQKAAKTPITPAFYNPQANNPVYALSAPKNAVRIGEPLPVIYGKVVTTPDFASTPYFSYQQTTLANGTHDAFEFEYTFLSHGSATGSGSSQYNNTHRWSMSLLCVGIGDFLTLKTLAGDTNIGNAEAVDLQYYPKNTRTSVVGNLVGHQEKNGVLSADFNIKKVGVYPPHSNRTIKPLFHENVITAIIFDGKTLNDDATAETSFTTGKYFVSEKENIKQVQIDISFVRGMTFDKITYPTGVPHDIVLHIEIFDSANVILKDIYLKIKYNLFLRQTLDPANRTFVIDIPIPQPVQLNITRISAKVADAMSEISLAGVKGVVDVSATKRQYGNVTLLATRIRSSEFTSSASAERIRSQVQRINLPNGVDSTTDITTNNPADVIYDIWNNAEYGAGRSDASTFDKALFAKLKAHWGGERMPGGFNAVFNQKTTVFEAMQTTANFVGSDLLMVGSELSLSYDNKKEVRRQLFTMANIVDGSFKINYKWDRIGEPDGVTIEFLSLDLFEPVFITHPGTSTNPRKVKLFGCTDGLYALQYAIYLWNKQTIGRKTVSFSTELEGLIPRVGDRIAISNDLADWGMSGNLVGYDSPTRTFTLDQDLGFAIGSTCQFILRTDSGTPYPANTPLTATVVGSNKIQTALPFPFPVDGFHYAVAKNTQITTDFIVNTISANDYQVDITASIYEESIYAGALPFMNREVT